MAKIKKRDIISCMHEIFVFFLIYTTRRKKHVRLLPSIILLPDVRVAVQSHCQAILTILQCVYIYTSIFSWRTRIRVSRGRLRSRISVAAQLLMNIHRRAWHARKDPFVPFFHSSSCTINGYMQIIHRCMLHADRLCMRLQQVFRMALLC